MRFKVCSVTGFADTGRRKPTSVWYVLDSANGYRIIESYVGGYRVGGRTWRAEDRAHTLAAELEAEYP